MVRRFLILMVLVVLTGSGSAQEPRYKFKDNKYVVEGSHAPKYFLVQEFFERAFRRHQDGKSAYDPFLRELQIRPETPAASYFTNAMLEAHQLSAEVLDMRPHVNASPDAWDALQMNFLKKKVRGMRKIYRTLQDLFEQAQNSFAGIERYIETRVRRSVSLMSFPDPPVKTMEVMDSFEREDTNQN